MSFAEAIRTGFRKYADFKGRARRSEFWYWFLFTVIVGIVAGMLDSALGLQPRLDTGEIDMTANGPIATVTSLALLLPNIAVAVRRLHDRGKSGWWVLLNLLPVIGSLILIFAYYIKDSEPGANRFGPNPKGVEGGYGSGYGAYDAGAYGQAPYGQAPYGQPGQYPYDQQGQQYGQPGAGQPSGQQGGYDPQAPQDPYSQQDPYGQQNPYGPQGDDQAFDPRNPYGQNPPSDQPPGNPPRP